MTTDDSTFPDPRYDALPLGARLSHRVRFDAASIFLVFTFLGLAAMALGYVANLRSVELVINNSSSQTVLTNQTTVAGVLSDAAIVLAPEDIVFPALDAPISSDQAIAIRYAYPIRVQVDGDSLSHRTLRTTIGDALGEANVTLKQGDRILVDGHLVEPNTPLPQVVAIGDRPAGTGLASPPPLTLEIQRAVPIQVDDNGALMTFYTTAPTLGEALRQAGLVVYLGDYVSPDLGMPVNPGWQVYIRRSIPATILVDGKTIRTRTRGNTVAELLAQEGVELKNQDFADPKPDKRLTEGMSVTIMRVREDILTESESIPYSTVWQADPTIEIDTHKVAQVGVAGVKKRQIRTRYENGKEVRRSLDREWIDSAPVTQLIAYGTKIVKRDLTLPDGHVVQYWRKIKLLATSYTAATSGKSRTNPTFGFTYLGWQAGTGIVAVDPRVINLRSNVYVPGYGLAVAGDTGGRIKGRRIDLGYDETNLALWYKWIEVYLLDPVPPADQIRWVLPELPDD